MALRDFLYPQLEVKLVLARALDVDRVQVCQGTLTKEYQDVAARITVGTKDAQRLGITMKSRIEVQSKHGLIVVRAQIDDKTPEGLVVMPPSPWANALLPSALPHQGVSVIIKSTKAPITKIHRLP